MKPTTDDAVGRFLESFDTAKILRMVDVIDGLAARTCGPASLRDDLLSFHTMAHRIINEGPHVPSSEALRELAASAADLSMEIDEWAQHLSDASRLLESLATAIAPDR